MSLTTGVISVLDQPDAETRLTILQVNAIYGNHC